MENLRITAIHEAGHFVAGYRMNIDNLEVSIEPDYADNRLGHNLQDDSHWSAKEGQDQVTALCAGYAAVAASGYDPEIASQGCGNDFEKAGQIIGFWGLPSLEEQKASTVEWMREAKNMRAVEAVADELMNQKTVASDFLWQIVAHADGECTDEELKMFRLFYAQCKQGHELSPDRQ